MDTKVATPLIEDGEMFINSNATPINEHTDNVLYLEVGGMGVVFKDGYIENNIDDGATGRNVKESVLSVEEFTGPGYPHFILKNIFEQPNSADDYRSCKSLNLPEAIRGHSR